MTTGSDMGERVRSYLLSQGERYTFAEIWVRFAKARLELIDSVSEVDQGQADFRPDVDEWSISEVLNHVVTSSGDGVGDRGRAVTRRYSHPWKDRPSQRGDVSGHQRAAGAAYPGLAQVVGARRAAAPGPIDCLDRAASLLRRASREGMAAVPAHPRHGPRGAGGEEQGGGDWRSRR